MIRFIFLDPDPQHPPGKWIPIRPFTVDSLDLNNQRFGTPDKYQLTVRKYDACTSELYFVGSGSLSNWKLSTGSALKLDSRHCNSYHRASDSIFHRTRRAHTEDSEHEIFVYVWDVQGPTQNLHYLRGTMYVFSCTVVVTLSFTLLRCHTNTRAWYSFTLVSVRINPIRMVI